MKMASYLWMFASEQLCFFGLLLGVGVMKALYWLITAVMNVQRLRALVDGTIIYM